MSENKEDLSIGQVAKETGISVHTLRQWERRYGYPISLKRESGHRRYPLKEISRLKLVAEALGLGYRAQEIVPMTRKNLIDLLQKHNGGGQSHSLAIEHWLDCVKKWDEKQLNIYCEQDWQTFGPIGFVEQRVAPFLKWLGECWLNQEISVAQEHFFSEIIESFLSKKWRATNAQIQGDTFVLASLDGEEHSLGLQMVAVVLNAAEKKVLYLGTPTPSSEIVSACSESDVVGLCLSFFILLDQKSD